jgi:peptidoglycan/xylan/chitin deacetylase (PgdA/CDA1 family)
LVTLSTSFQLAVTAAMPNQAELLSRLERLLGEGQVREAWQQLDYARTNGLVESSAAAFLEQQIEQASKPEDRIGRVSIATWPNGSSAAVSCTFDDRLTSHVDIVRPDLDRFGFPGTFFVIRAHASLPPLSADYWSKWQALGQSHHEIGNHTAEHPHGLPSLAAAEIHRQIEQCDEFIERELGHPRANSFAYPHGVHGPQDGYLRRYVRRRFAAARSTQSQPIGINAVSPEHIDALSSFTVNGGSSLEQVQQQLDNAITGGGWAILTFHKVAQGEGAGEIERSFWIACLNSLSARRDRLWIATLQAVAAYIAARRSARIVCQTTAERMLSISVQGDSRRASQPLVALSASVRVPKSWRFARHIDADGSATDYRVQAEAIRIPVWADGRPFHIRKLR